MEKNTCSAFHLIWLSYVWAVWHDINTRIFQEKGDFINQLIEKFKLQSFRWLKANHHSFAYTYHMWWLNPLSRLGVLI